MAAMSVNFGSFDTFSTFGTVPVALSVREFRFLGQPLILRLLPREKGRGESDREDQFFMRGRLILDQRLGMFLEFAHYLLHKRTHITV